MSPQLMFQQFFGDVLARQVEYSYSDVDDSVTTMVPLKRDGLPRVLGLAKAVAFSGEWAWAVERFTVTARPEDFLFRVDWTGSDATALTLYSRFPIEPDAAEFQRVMRSARPLAWHGPDTSAVAAALQSAGPRGIAFRASRTGHLRTAVYYRTAQHAGGAWSERLVALLAACGYPSDLAATIESDLKDLYQPGPVGVIGVDDGDEGKAGSLKFDPANVPTNVALAFLARMQVRAERIDALRRIAAGLRAKFMTYAGAQYGPHGFSGWRLYVQCEPSNSRLPGAAAIVSPRHLRPARSLSQH
jgi:hypothetical protein